MAANNADFQSVYHASWRSNRQKIESEGLKASQPWDTQPAGIYVAKNPGVTMHYGDDIYEISISKHEELPEDEMEPGARIIPRDVPISDFKRTGHVFRDSQGFPQVHLHKEEDCPNAS